MLNALITTAVTFLLGFWVAYYLALVVPDLRRKFALFIIALAPFFTSFLIRAIAWIPMMGREGLLNSALLNLGIISQPLDFLLYSEFAVRVAMVQLYLLFMVSPIFFSLTTIEPAILEAARDSGAGWWAICAELLLPLARPGIVIGAVFVFVLSMGEFATVRLIGGGKTSSVGLGIELLNYIQFPQAAAAASIWFWSRLSGSSSSFGTGAWRRGCDDARSPGYARERWVNVGLGVYFGAILLFLYGPIIVMAILSFQGPRGGMTFPMQGFSFHWWGRLFGERATELGPAIVRSLVVAVETGLIAAAFSVVIAFAYRRRLPGARFLFPAVILALMTPGILLGLGVSLWWRLLNATGAPLAARRARHLGAAVRLPGDAGGAQPLRPADRGIGARPGSQRAAHVLRGRHADHLAGGAQRRALRVHPFAQRVRAQRAGHLPEHVPLHLWAMLTVQIIEQTSTLLGTLTTLVTFAIVGALFIPTLLGQLRRVSRRGPE